MLCVVGWLAPSAKAPMQVSMMLAPASTAFRCAMCDSPEVAWLWVCTGRPVASMMALTRSKATCGARRPAMSLMAMLSQPISAKPFASFTKCGMSCTGLVV